LKLTFFYIDEPVGSGSYQELPDVILDSSIHSRIHQGAKQESAILLSGDRDGPALEIKQNLRLPTEINRRHPECNEFTRTPKMSQKKVKAMFCEAV